jgi:hypothetical protein
MFGRNKWVIAHPDDLSFQGTRAHYGLVGRNIELTTL